MISEATIHSAGKVDYSATEPSLFQTTDRVWIPSFGEIYNIAANPSIVAGRQDGPQFSFFASSFPDPSTAEAGAARGSLQKTRSNANPSSYWDTKWSLRSVVNASATASQVTHYAIDNNGYDYGVVPSRARSIVICFFIG